MSSVVMSSVKDLEQIAVVQPVATAFEGIMHQYPVLKEFLETQARLAASKDIKGRRYPASVIR